MLFPHCKSVRQPLAHSIRQASPARTCWSTIHVKHEQDGVLYPTDDAGNSRDVAMVMFWRQVGETPIFKSLERNVGATHVTQGR